MEQEELEEGEVAGEEIGPEMQDVYHIFVEIVDIV